MSDETAQRLAGRVVIVTGALGVLDILVNDTGRRWLDPRRGAIMKLHCRLTMTPTDRSDVYTVGSTGHLPMPDRLSPPGPPLHSHAPLTSHLLPPGHMPMRSSR
jgi:hypothetical protein